MSTVGLIAAGLVALGGAGAPVAADPVCQGDYILCDDFNGPRLDASLWTRGDQLIAGRKIGPENIRLTTIMDKGVPITVVEARAFGDRHSAAPRQGGVIISRERYGGGRYEVRMRNLPDYAGCSCIWIYYDSNDERRPPAVQVYTEIDIEMPAHLRPPPAWSNWRRVLGLNTWADSEADENATYINHASDIDPFDGEFHVFRFDWRDGSDGVRRIEWYVDDVFQASTTENVGTAPAQLWVGNWPAPWPGMSYDFKVKRQYIDWIRISPLL